MSVSGKSYDLERLMRNWGSFTISRPDFRRRFTWDSETMEAVRSPETFQPRGTSLTTGYPHSPPSPLSPLTMTSQENSSMKMVKLVAGNVYPVGILKYNGYFNEKDARRFGLQIIVGGWDRSLVTLSPDHLSFVYKAGQPIYVMVPPDLETTITNEYGECAP